MSRDAANPWTFVIDEETRLLFVDDDPILAEFAKVHLATPATKVDVAADGEEAWERLCSERFDLVLLDIEMPRLDGFDLLARLRADARFAAVPVVMLTGREDIASIDRAFQLGANSFITKPINWRQLSYSLRYVLRTTRMEAELLRERERSRELLRLTTSLLSLIRIEARTPLSAIIGFCDCITEQIDGPVPPNYLKYGEQIQSAARQLQDNFLDLIQYAQLASGAATLARDEYSAAKLLDAAISGLGREVTERAAIRVVKPERSFELSCDLMWLARALRHLIEVASNGATSVELSISLTPEGGARATIVAAPAPDAVGARQAASPENVRHEMGVGVAFAKCVIELHGGALIVVEGKDGSETMEIVFPPSLVVSAKDRRRGNEAA